MTKSTGAWSAADPRAGTPPTPERCLGRACLPTAEAGQRRRLPAQGSQPQGGLLTNTGEDRFTLHQVLADVALMRLEATSSHAAGERHYRHYIAVFETGRNAAA